MDDKLRQQLQDAMGEFTKHRDELDRIRREVAVMSVTARSHDRVVEVTVSARGETTGLRFLDNKHQSMTGQQLASSVLQAMSLAREEMGRRVQASTAAMLGGGLGAALGVAGTGLEKLDLDRLLEPLASEGLLVEPTKEPGR